MRTHEHGHKYVDNAVNLSMNAPSVARILIADDHHIVRTGLKTLLSDSEDLKVDGEASSGMEALKMVRESDWDIVLLDISMPDMNGVDALAQIKRAKPELPVLILSMHPEDQYAISLLRAGASGYVCKDGAPEQLITAIRTVIGGRRYVSPQLSQQLVGHLNGDMEKPIHTELSEREFQVFCRLAGGQAVSKIAHELALSVKTISTYRLRILQKMSLKTNADLTYYAIKHGFIQ